MSTPTETIVATPESSVKTNEMGIIVYHGMRPKDVSYLLVDSKTMVWVLYGFLADDETEETEEVDSDEDDSDEDDDTDEVTTTADSRAFNVAGHSFYSLQSLLQYVVENNIRVTNEYIASSD